MILEKLTSPKKKLHPKVLRENNQGYKTRANVTKQSCPVKDGPRNLPLKFGQNRMSSSWDVADIVWWGGGGYAKSFSCKNQL